MSDVVRIANDHLFDEPIRRVQSLFTEDLLNDDQLAEARDRVAASFMKYASMPNPAQAFRYFNHTPRDTAAFAYGIMKAHKVITPFDDPSMVRFALGLPWRISSNPDLQSDAIRRRYPAHADVPFYWDVPRTTRTRHWDASVESMSAIPMLSRFPTNGLPRFNDIVRARIEAGEGDLRDIQVATYISQLTSWVGGLTKTIPTQQVSG